MNPPPRSEAPAWLPFVIIPLGVVLLRIAYHAHRSVFALKLSELGVTPVQLGIALGFGEALAFAGYALGAALYSVRPNAPARVGALLCALGLGLFTFNPAAWTTAEVLLRLGVGCFQLGALVMLIARCAGFQQRMLAVAALLGAGALGGFLGPLLGATSYASARQGVGLLALLPVLLCVVASGLLIALPPGNEMRIARGGSLGSGRRWLLSLALCVFGALYSVLKTASKSLPIDVEPTAWTNFGAQFGSPMVGALGVVLVGVSVREGAWSRARSFGVGLMLFAGAALVSAHAAEHGLNARMLAGQALAGFAHPIVEALLLAALFGAWPKRRAGLVYFGFMLLVGFAQARAWVAFSASPVGDATVNWWSAALGLVLGVAVIAFSRPIEALLTASEVDPPQPAPTDATE